MTLLAPLAVTVQEIVVRTHPEHQNWHPRGGFSGNLTRVCRRRHALGETILSEELGIRHSYEWGGWSVYLVGVEAAQRRNPVRFGEPASALSISRRINQLFLVRRRVGRRQ